MIADFKFYPGKCNAPLLVFQFEYLIFFIHNAHNLHNRYNGIELNLLRFNNKRECFFSRLHNLFQKIKT
jgi:hypothetical protein